MIQLIICGEWTAEKRVNMPIYRLTVIKKDSYSYFADRLSSDEKYKDENIGFRTIIYK